MSIVGNRIRIVVYGMTLMACFPGLDQERRFLAALAAARRIRFDGPFLVLHPSGQGAPTRFARVEAAAHR
jgi:heat shock protein HslJ